MCCGNRKPINTQSGTLVPCPGGDKTFKPDAFVIAQKFGLDLCSITGTGLGGLVLRQDVDRALGR